MRFAIHYSKFLAHLSFQCSGDILAIVDMAANCGIPLTGLYGFPLWAMLQIEMSCRIEQVQMHHRMQEFCTIVTLTTGGAANNLARLIYYW